MESLIDRAALQASPTYQIIPAHQRVAWLNRVASLIDCDRPFDGEVFESKDHCLQRLNDWGFREGAAFVITRTRPDGTPNWTFSCAFHSEKSANKRRLDSEVIRDEDGEVTSKRRRNTYHQRRGCLCEYFLSYKLVSKVTQEREYTGFWRQPTHNGHPHPLNPFTFQVHLAQTPEFINLQTTARKYRVSKQPYSEARKMLRQEEVGSGLLLKPKQYYNLIRRQGANKQKDGTIIALLQSLDEQNFKYRTLTHCKLDEQEGLTGPPNGREILIQIVFWLSESLPFVRRFCSGFLLVVDATFNTNSLRLPLMVAVGITNEGVSFPVAYSFCPGETADSYSFFFEVLRSEIWPEHAGIPEPAVILADQSSGLLSAVTEFDAIPASSTLQICNWHAVQAMLTKFRKEKYTAKEVDGYTIEIPGNNAVKVDGLHHLCWNYVESTTFDELEANRAALLAKLQPLEQAYILQTWLPKEDRVVYCYTKKLPNLGSVATQRGEGFHRIIHQITNGQMSLDESARQLAIKTKDCYIQMVEAEDRAVTAVPTNLIDRKPFDALIGQVSLLAIKLIAVEWKSLTTEITTPPYQVSGDCVDCKLLRQYGLPCKHWLSKPFLQGVPIPKTLIHPRWWIRGPVAMEWAPLFDRQPLVFSPKKTSVAARLTDVLNSREKLTAEELSRFDEQIIQAANNLQDIADKRAVRLVQPIGQPHPNEKKSWKKKNLTANSRALTAHELALHNQKLQQTRQAQDSRDALIEQERQAHKRTLEESQMTVWSTIEVAVAQEEEDNDSEPPTPTTRSLESIPHCGSPSPPSPQPSPPPSTAPAALGRGRRQRRRTDRKEEAIAAGLLADSQQRHQQPA